MRTGLMFTAAGMIKNIQETWNSEETHKAFSSQGDGKHFSPVKDMKGISGELFRKFCSRCHVATANDDTFQMAHASGCAACHFPYNNSATYEGSDPTMRGRAPVSKTHKMTGLPGTEVCLKCHNRSGRIGLSYIGLLENPAGGPTSISYGRHAVHITPDIHYAKGMDCIDCHTSRDVMGDGKPHTHWYDQVEIRCEDCHGSGSQTPKTTTALRENEDAIRESRQYAQPIALGSQLVTTSRGRPFSNVVFDKGTYLLITKRTGRRLPIRQILGSREHTINGHDKMACTACHSKAVPQCFGCHTQYNQQQMGMDYIQGKETPGRFSETEDARSAYPFALVCNRLGKIEPTTPGCQTFVSITDKDGKSSKQEDVFPFRGKRQLRFAPFYSHNTGTRAVGCRECHTNPAFMGFGQYSVLSRDTLEPTLQCECSQEPRPLDGFQLFQNGKISSFAAVTQAHSRPLGNQEIRRTWGLNLCLVCHDQARDPIFQKPLASPMLVLADTTHKKILGENWVTHLATSSSSRSEPPPPLARPEPSVTDQKCLKCHADGGPGTAYYGMAPRDPSPRFERGIQLNGKYYLKMTPDIHAEKGLTCTSCHSHSEGPHKKTETTRVCKDCHSDWAKKPNIIEHQIPSHADKLDCSACHSAWMAQDYGNIHTRGFPPLGISKTGKITPIQPNPKKLGEWQPRFPHTVRRGTPGCDTCHHNPARFLLEKVQDRIYDLRQDGLPLDSYWNQKGQRIKNGAFVSQKFFDRMSRQSIDFQKAYIKKWKHLLDSVDSSSSP